MYNYSIVVISHKYGTVEGDEQYNKEWIHKDEGPIDIILDNWLMYTVVVVMKKVVKSDASS